MYTKHHLVYTKHHLVYTKHHLELYTCLFFKGSHTCLISNWTAWHLDLISCGSFFPLSLSLSPHPLFPLRIFVRRSSFPLPQSTQMQHMPYLAHKLKTPSDRIPPAMLQILLKCLLVCLQLRSLRMNLGSSLLNDSLAVIPWKDSFPCCCHHPYQHDFLNCGRRSDG